MSDQLPVDVLRPTFETDELIAKLVQFLDSPFPYAGDGATKVGNYKWGVYAFFDYDGEPIYVGQTNEKLRARIRRHLTNQRTDAVAMSVLDPFEVLDIEVWPLPELEGVSGKDREAKSKLNALERLITERAVENSRFKAILNEKGPPPGVLSIEIPPSLRGRIVSENVMAIRAHPDIRIARRAQIIARLAQVISERELKGGGLRRVLVTQARRLQWLSERRLSALGADGDDADE